MLRIDSYQFVLRGILASTFLILAACSGGGLQQAPVSIEEAKQVAANFTGQNFNPPRRTITDILEILENVKPDPTVAAANRARAEAQPPAGSTPETLVQFYVDRSSAARDVGWMTRQLEDARLAWQLAKSSNLIDQPRRVNVLVNLQASEVLAGNGRTSLEIAEERLKAARQIGPSSALHTSMNSAVWNYAQYGNLPRASALLAEAERLFRSRQFRPQDALELPIWQATSGNARAAVALASGDFEEAVTQSRTAVRYWREALSNYPLYSQKASPAVWAATRDVYQIRLGVGLLGAGRLMEAEATAREFLRDSLAGEGRNSQSTVLYAALLASVLAEQGRFADSVRLDEEVMQIARGLGSVVTSTHFAAARVRIAAAHVAVARWTEALAMFEAAAVGLAGESPSVVDFYLITPDHVLALYGGTRFAEGLTLARRLLAKWRESAGERNYVTAEARALVGMGLVRSGASDAALVEFRAAVPILLQRSRQPEGDGSSGAMRNLRLGMILEAYIDLLAALHEQGSAPPGMDAAAEAFWVADALRERGVQRALGAAGARAAVRDPQLADLVRQEQDARHRIGALIGLFNNHVSLRADQRDPSVLAQMQVSIDKLRDARAVLAREIERQFPDYADLIDPQPATTQQARASLRPGEAMLALHVGARKTLVWAIPSSGPIAFAAVPMGEAQVERAVQTLRYALDTGAQFYGEIPAFDVELAHNLYRQLIEPVARGWEGAQNLLVVPHKALGRLPLSLLVTAAIKPVAEREGQALFAGYKEVPFLARKLALTQLPSVASLISLRRIPPPAANRRAFIGFGDPWFSTGQAAEARGEGRTLLASMGQAEGPRELPVRTRSGPGTRGLNSAELAHLPRLPETADEVRAIAQALGADPTQDVILGAAANERIVTSMRLSDRRVVMFATHGLLAGDLDGLDQPALALSAPQVAGVGGDGLLTVEKILGLKLDADWVVLSACNSAAGDGAGAEAISGLGRAFFYAGSRALLVSHWPVETASAKALTTDIFRRQAADPTLSRVQSTRQAMLGLIDGQGLVDANGRSIVSYAHPIFWAPFALVGDGG